jgi:nitrous oxidase accessory protein
MKKYIAFGIIIIFLFGIVPITSSYSYSNKIIYVDDDGGADYTRIQDAIDNARNGDTIFVYAGTYYEHLVIFIPLFLIGENQNTTIIDGNNIGNVLYIESNGVSISGFTIQNGIGYGIKIYKGLNVAITNNTIRENGGGFQIYMSSNTEVSGNTVERSTYDGVEVRLSSRTTVIGNTIKGNLRGCLLLGGSFNKFMQNNFIDNRWQAYFDSNLLDFNRWSGNYWDNCMPLFPKPILGRINYGAIIWIKFDWNPATEPYDITC